MIQEINQQELQEFLRWCGWTNNGCYWFEPIEFGGNRYAPYGDKYNQTPRIDPNFLIKYAVPKMRYVNLQFSEQYSDVIPQFSATASTRFADNHTWADNDPAIALYRAIQQAKEAINEQ